MFEIVKQDVLRTWNYAVGGRSRRFFTCVRAPGVRAVVTFRFGQWVQRRPVPLRIVFLPLYWFFEGRIRSRWGIDLPRAAQIGPGLYIGHHGGIIISGAARIGRDLTISQGVTVGIGGQGARRGAPTIGDCVYLAPGCKVFGKITVGDRAVIGANAVVYRDIPAGATAVLKPGFEVLSAPEAEAGPTAGS